VTRILVLSGPNLDQLGTRDPALYGTETLGDLIARLEKLAATRQTTISHTSSNFEGELIEAIHAARQSADALIINAGALTHTSWALRDALELFDGPKVEVHLSNPAGREPFRHVSTLAAVVDGSIAGFKGASYDLALEAVLRLLAERA
jgi:3-dehydroquinate dehydratase-2